MIINRCKRPSRRAGRGCEASILSWEPKAGAAFIGAQSRRRYRKKARKQNCRSHRRPQHRLLWRNEFSQRTCVGTVHVAIPDTAITRSPFSCCNNLRARNKPNRAAPQTKRELNTCIDSTKLSCHKATVAPKFRRHSEISWVRGKGCQR